MKIVVIGGTGLIGSKVATRLRAAGHEVLAAAPSTGVDTITGVGLDAALEGARVVVDVANSPSFEDAAVLEFFRTAGGNLLAAEKRAGVGHHVALSIVGADRAPDSGYLRAKVVQEELVRASGVPFTIVRATQFFEFLRAIAASATDGDTVRATPATLQPIAAQEVADFVAEVALEEAGNATIEIGGPAAVGLDELLRAVLAADHDPHTVVSDPHARYFGAELDDAMLTPSAEAQLGTISLSEWLDANTPAPVR